jgi:hypothetical protein
MPASIPMNFNFVQRLLPQRVVLVNSDEQQEVKAPEKNGKVEGSKNSHYGEQFFLKPFVLLFSKLCNQYSE